MDAFFTRYIDLVEKSNFLNQTYLDKLNKLPKQKGISSKLKSHKSTSSNQSENSSLSSNPISDDIEPVI